MNTLTFIPTGMFGRNCNDSPLEVALRDLAGQFGEAGDWPEKYGANVDTDVFSMRPFCWCEREDCPQCWDESVHGKQAPNFHYKPTGFKVWWYKYIGRSMEVSAQLSTDEIIKIFNHCAASKPTP